MAKSSGGWQPDLCHRATVRLAPQVDVAAPASGELARDREAQAGSRRPPAPGAAAMEAAEHGILLAAFQAVTAVAHLAPARDRGHGDLAAVRGAAAGVLDQRVEDAVGVAGRQPCVAGVAAVRDDALTPRARSHLPAAGGPRGDVCERQALGSAVALAGAAQLEQLLHHRAEPVELAER